MNVNLLAPIANLFRSPAVRQRDAVLSELTRDLKRAERRLREAYGYADDLVSGWERERDELLQGSGLTGRRGSRKDGGEWPFLRTMQDLIDMRAASREACEGNGYGAGMLDRAIDFVIGDGMQHEVTRNGPKKGAVATGIADLDGDGRPDADPRVEAVEAVIEEFRRLNDWGCGEEDREEEGFRRSQRDGEVFVRFFAGDGGTNGIPFVRWIEPEQVDSPPSAELNERWGIRYKKGDVESKEAVWVYDLDGTEGDWVPWNELVFHKLGTDRTVLRGVPQFWLVARALYQSDALNSALSEVSAIQAKIAYVREHAPGIMPGQITEFVGGTGDGTGVKRTPYGDKYRRTGIQEEGTTVDMSSGMKFTAGPVSTGVPAFVQALQSRLRQVCARFGYPEFFTGDASNNNYASSLTAGGPAERAFKRKQHRYAGFQAAVYRRACEYAVKAGRLSRSDLAAVEIKVKPGGVAIANKLEEAQVQQIRIQNKVLSPQSAMVENGRDPKVEMANIKAWDDQFGAGAMGLGGGGGMVQDDGGDPFGGGFAQAGESYTGDEYEMLSEADRSHLVRKTITNSKGRKQVVWVRANANNTTTHTRQQVSDARSLVAKAVNDPNSLNPEEFAALAKHLETVNRDEIRGLLKQVQAKVGGTKQQLAERLVEKVKAGRTAGVGDALARGDTPIPNPGIPTTGVDNPTDVGNTTTAQPQSAGANTGGGGMSTKQATDKILDMLGSHSSGDWSGKVVKHKNGELKIYVSWRGTEKGHVSVNPDGTVTVSDSLYKNMSGAKILRSQIEDVTHEPHATAAHAPEPTLNGSKYTASQLQQVADQVRSGRPVGDDDAVVDAVKWGFLSRDAAMNRDY